MDLPRFDVPTVAVLGGSARFPVRRIFCVGQNYADHAREMGSDPDRQPPFFFSKPADAVVESGSTIAFPAMTENLHHEVELVIAIGAAGRDLGVDEAAGIIFGYAAGIDLTRRDLQATAKKAGLPWDMAKGFDNSAPVGAIVPGQPPAEGAISLSVNGAVRQKGDLADMIWKVPEILVALSALVELRPGDLVFTGTPSGVGPLSRGDVVDAVVAGAPELKIRLGS